MSVMMTLALGTAAPEESDTVPTMVPETAWLQAMEEKANRTSAANFACIILYLRDVTPGNFPVLEDSIANSGVGRLPGKAQSELQRP